MKKSNKLKFAGLVLLFAAFLSSGISTALGAYDLDYGPSNGSGQYGSYVLSAVQGGQSGSSFTTVEFWGYSYAGSASPVSYPNGPIYCTWQAGDYWGLWITGDWSTTQNTLSGQTLDSGVISHTCTWAQSSVHRSFAQGSGQDYHEWTYSCSSSISI